MASLIETAIERRRLAVQGIVQGVGFRPFVYGLASRIRLSSSESVLQEAERVIRTIVSTYPRTNLTAEQIEAQAVNGHDPLRAFSDTCRIELESLQREL